MFATKGKLRVDGARNQWLTSSCAAPAAESWYRKRVAASPRLSNTTARKQRRGRRERKSPHESFCVRSSFCYSDPFATVLTADAWSLTFPLDFPINATFRRNFRPSPPSPRRRRRRRCCFPSFPLFALSRFPTCVTCENAPREARLTRERPYRVLKGTARLLLARIHDSGYELVNGNAHRFVRGVQRIEPVTDGLPTSGFETRDPGLHEGNICQAIEQPWSTLDNASFHFIERETCRELGRPSWPKGFALPTRQRSVLPIALFFPFSCLVVRAKSSHRRSNDIDHFLTLFLTSRVSALFRVRKF